MGTQSFLVFTSAQRTTAMGLDDDANAAIDPRAVDNASPGVGLNLNDLSSEYDPGDPVTLTSCFVAPKRIIDDPDYNHYCPDLVDYLKELPFCLLDSDAIFAPIED